jgi:hypothetical protein
MLHRGGIQRYFIHSANVSSKKAALPYVHLVYTVTLLYLNVCCMIGNGKVCHNGDVTISTIQFKKLKKYAIKRQSYCENAVNCETATLKPLH